LERPPVGPAEQLDRHRLGQRAGRSPEATEGEFALDGRDGHDGKKKTVQGAPWTVFAFRPRPSCPSVYLETSGSRAKLRCGRYIVGLSFGFPLGDPSI